MIDEENLIKLIKNDENPKVEFKSSEYVKGKKNCELSKAMAGFANYKGGKILIGVNDDGTIEGFSCNKGKIKKYQESVYQLAGTNCNPPIIPEIDSIKLDEGVVLVIDIPKNSGNPVRACGKFYIRHGNTTRELTQEELQQRYNKSKTEEAFDDLKTISFDGIKEQFENRGIIHEGKVVPYIEFESPYHHECVLYSKIYNTFFEKAYYLEESFGRITIDYLKQILLTYYDTFIKYTHYHSAFNISASGLSWIGYSPNNFIKALTNQNLRYSQVKKKFGDDVYIHHRESACFIDEIESAIFYIAAQPNKISNNEELTIDYVNVGFIFNNIPFNHIYYDFFRKINLIPESLNEINEDLTQIFPLKNISFLEDGFITNEYDDGYYVSGIYGKIPQQLQKNATVNRHDKIIVNLRNYHEIKQKNNYDIYHVKATQIPTGNFPAYILNFEGNW